MRGRVQSKELLHNPKIEKTTRVNGKLVRLARSAEGIPRAPQNSPYPTETEPITKEDNPPPPPPYRPMMGDYGLTTNHDRLSHIFQPLNPVDFDIKAYV
jgi:hypothetical protein